MYFCKINSNVKTTVHFTHTCKNHDVRNNKKTKTGIKTLFRFMASCSYRGRVDSEKFSRLEVQTLPLDLPLMEDKYCRSNHYSSKKYRGPKIIVATVN